MARQDALRLYEECAETRERLLDAIGKVIVGQREVVELMLISMFSDGHCLFVGVPGLAKTLLVNTVARAVGLDFGRVQFTPDLMPSDITGTDVLEEDKASGQRRLRFVRGPIFTNLLLADEINRTPPKTQAALLEAMQERAVTAAGSTHRLERPFLVFATQNPIEQEGTYPLPEAQQDRFMLSVHVGYPTVEEEEEIVRRTTRGTMPECPRVLDRERLLAMQQAIRETPLNSDVVRHCVRLATATRPGSGYKAARWIRWGAGPRASQNLAIGARTLAALRGNETQVIHAGADSDLPPWLVKAILRHRIILNFEAEAAGMTTDAVLDELIAEVG